MNTDKKMRTSRPAVTPFKRPKKPIISASEKERQERSLKEFYVGGDDAS